MSAPSTPRVPLRIRLPFTSEAEFIERYGVHVTRAGIFIATRAPKTQGTPIAFELVLQDGARLMRGEGNVQQVIDDPTPGRMGMQVRFERLDVRSRDLIERIVLARAAIGISRPTAAAPRRPSPSSPPTSAAKPEDALAPSPGAPASMAAPEDGGAAGPPPGLGDAQASTAASSLDPSRTDAPTSATAPWAGAPGSSAPQHPDGSGSDASAVPAAGGAGSWASPAAADSDDLTRAQTSGAAGLGDESDPGGAIASVTASPTAHPGSVNLSFATPAERGATPAPGRGDDAPSAETASAAGPPEPSGSFEPSWSRTHHGDASTTLANGSIAPPRALTGASTASAQARADDSAALPGAPGDASTASPQELADGSTAPPGALSDASTASPQELADGSTAPPGALPDASTASPQALADAATASPQALADAATASPQAPADGSTAPPRALADTSTSPSPQALADGATALPRAPADGSNAPPGALEDTGSPQTLAAGATAPPRSLAGASTESPPPLADDSTAPPGALSEASSASPRALEDGPTARPGALSDASNASPQALADGSTAPPGALAAASPQALADSSTDSTGAFAAASTASPQALTEGSPVPPEAFAGAPTAPSLADTVPLGADDEAPTAPGHAGPSPFFEALLGGEVNPTVQDDAPTWPGGQATSAQEPAGDDDDEVPWASAEPDAPEGVSARTASVPPPPSSGGIVQPAPQPSAAEPAPSPEIDDEPTVERAAVIARPDTAAARGPSARSLDLPPLERRADPAARVEGGQRRRTADFAPAPAPSGPPPLADDVLLGIDLGASGVRAALFLNGALAPVPLASDGATLAALVALESPGALVLGPAAAAVRAKDPSAAAFGLKRLLGLRFHSEAVARLQPQLPFGLLADAHGDVAVELGGKRFRVAELVATLLREVARAASGFAGRQLTRAVLTVPAGYTLHQTRALLEAAGLAGLEVSRLLSEPAAVALAFGFGKGLARKRLAVLDLGAGKFDAAVIAVTGDDLEVIAASGDGLLGGFELDALALTSLEPRAREARRTALEAERPSDAPDARPAPEVTGLVERALAIAREALASARVTAADLDELLLVGGPAKARPFAQAFEALLGRAPRTDLHPTHAVAFGAALAGHALVLKERGKPSFSASEVLSTTLSAGQRGGALRPILERNTRLPAEKTLAIPIPDLQPVVLPIFQGATLLGTLTTRGEKPGELAVRFALSADGRLTITAIGQSSRKGQGTFSPADPGPSRAALLDNSPLLPQQAPTDKGLFKGLKRLFGR